MEVKKYLGLFKKNVTSANICFYKFKNIFCMK